MKHSDWLRLNKEGEQICAVFRQQGYQCRKQSRRLSWQLSRIGQGDFTLTWLPAPVGDWSLLPNDQSPVREKMWAIVQNALAPKPGQALTAQRVQQSEDYSRPWAIVRLLPDAQRYVVTRFFNRQDADDHRRFLNRFMPASEFEVIFDVPNSQLNNDIAHIN
ncbi:MAG TPA: hypothetical protein V6C63_07765 [Allocoleopsis sp.]